MAVVLPFVATFVDKGAKEAIASIKKVESQWGKFGDGLKKAAVPAAAVGGALVTGLVAAKKAAGDAAKSQKVLRAALSNAGWEQNTKALSDYAVAMSKTTGIDANSIRLAMAKLSVNDELAASTEKMGKVTMLAADMAAQGYGSMESNATLLAKALNDPVKGMMALNRMGITMSKDQQAEVKALVAAGDVAAAQQVLLLGIADKVGGAAVKNASATAKMRAEYTALAVQIGSALLPPLSKLATMLSGLFQWMSQNATAVKVIVVAIGSLVSAILLLNAAMKVQQAVSTATAAAHKLFEWAIKKDIVVQGAAAASTSRLTASMLAQKAAALASAAAQKVASTATRLMTVAQRGLNAAMKANPIGLVVTLLFALAAALKYAWNHSETFRRIVTKAFNAVKSVATNVFNAVVAVIQPVISALQRIIDLAKNVASSISNVISKLPGLRNAQSEVGSIVIPGPASRAAVPGVTINITGAIDPESVARQVRKLLNDHDIRQGRRVAERVAW